METVPDDAAGFIRMGVWWESKLFLEIYYI